MQKHMCKKWFSELAEFPLLTTLGQKGRMALLCPPPFGGQLGKLWKKAFARGPSRTHLRLAFAVASLRPCPEGSKRVLVQSIRSSLGHISVTSEKKWPRTTCIGLDCCSGWWLLGSPQYADASYCLPWRPWKKTFKTVPIRIPPGTRHSKNWCHSRRTWGERNETRSPLPHRPQ